MKKLYGKIPKRTPLVADNVYVRQDRVYRLHLNVSVRILNILNPPVVWDFPPVETVNPVMN